MPIGATISGYVSWNSPHARSSACRVMKACSVATASGYAAASKKAATNRRKSAGEEAASTCSHTARTPGALSMTSSAFAAASIPGGSSSSTA